MTQSQDVVVIGHKKDVTGDLGYRCSALAVKIVGDYLYSNLTWQTLWRRLIEEDVDSKKLSLVMYDTQSDREEEEEVMSPGLEPCYALARRHVLFCSSLTGLAIKRLCRLRKPDVHHACPSF